MAPKLTPTFADQVKQNGGLHVVSAQPSPEALRFSTPNLPKPTNEISAEVNSFLQQAEKAPKRRAGRPKKAKEVSEPIAQAPVTPTPMPLVFPTITTGPVPVVVPAQLKVALVGTAPSSRMLAPYNDPSWKIWACSPGNMGQLPRVDAWFEIHANLLWPECVSYGAPYIEWLKQQKFPIFMQDQSLVPNAQTFPKNEVIAEFGKYFLTSSFAWMMGKAILDGVKEIALFGIDMASRNEYLTQRSGAYFFFHECARRGIKISAPFESDIMMHPGLYGYSDATPFGRKLLARKKEIEDRINPMKAERDRLNQNIIYLEGALEDIDYCATIWSGAQQ